MKMLEPFHKALKVDDAWADPDIEYYIQSIFRRFSELVFSQWLDNRRMKDGAPMLCNQDIKFMRGVIRDEVLHAFPGLYDRGIHTLAVCSGIF
jgi:hypothetical protein